MLVVIGLTNPLPPFLRSSTNNHADLLSLHPPFSSLINNQPCHAMHKRPADLAAHTQLRQGGIHQRVHFPFHQTRVRNQMHIRATCIAFVSRPLPLSFFLSLHLHLEGRHVTHPPRMCFFRKRDPNKPPQPLSLYLLTHNRRRSSPSCKSSSTTSTSTTATTWPSPPHNPCQGARPDHHSCRRQWWRRRRGRGRVVVVGGRWRHWSSASA